MNGRSMKSCGDTPRNAWRKWHPRKKTCHQLKNLNIHLNKKKMSKEYWNIFFQLSALLTMLAAAALFQAVFYHAGISEKNTAAIAHRRMGEFIRVPDVSEPELSAESVLVSRLQTGPTRRKSPDRA